VTGASRGIGRATATRLARAGYRTLLIARSAELLHRLAAELSGHAPSHALPMDLCRLNDIQPTLRDALQQHGPCDVLVNNAGSGYLAPATDWSRADHQRMLDIHYLAPVELMHAVLPAMRERRRGHIVNICSIATRIAPWGHGGYTAAKSALDKLTQTMHAELSPDGVRLTSVHPAVIDTAFFEQPSYDQLRQRVRRHAVPPERVANAIERVLRRPRLRVFVPGGYGLIGAAACFMPRLTHGWIARQSRV